MKAKRLLFLVMAICLASGVKAQFYDSADDIYYYVEYKNGEFAENASVRVLNFDGKKAAVLNHNYFDGDGDGPFYLNLSKIKNKLREQPDYFEQQIETTDYNVIYTAPASYIFKSGYRNGGRYYSYTETWTFSSNRDFLYETSEGWGNNNKKTYKRVFKSFFRVGRSRTPSGTIYE